MDPMERIEKLFAADVVGLPKRKQITFEPRPTDVVVVGPAKCGTTWMQQILHQIRMKGNENYKDIYEVSPWLHFRYGEYDLDPNMDQVANPRMFKTHDRCDIVVPKCDGMKFVVVFRDPFDCQYSFIKFVLRHAGGHEDLDDDTALERFRVASSHGNDYFGLMMTWWAHRNDPNVLWIYYEDLKTDLRFCIEKIAQFLGIPLTPDELSTVHGFCTFEYMSQHDDKFHNDPLLESMAKLIESKRWQSNCAAVRKDGGKIGEGRKSIGPKLREAIKERWAETIGKQMGFADYDTLYKETSFLKKYGRDIGDK